MHTASFPCRSGPALLGHHGQRQHSFMPCLAHKKPRLATTVVRAEAGGSGLGGLFGKKGGAKEDAARKALEDALKGKKDPFAAAEERAKRRGGSGGGGGGGGGGGSGGGGGGGFSFNEWGDKFGKGARSLLNTVGAILLFGAVMFLFTLWQPALRLLVQLVRLVLRLDANPRAQLQAQKAAPALDLNKKEGLGNVEESIIGKYGGDAEGESEGEEQEE